MNDILDFSTLSNTDLQKEYDRSIKEYHRLVDWDLELTESEDAEVYLILTERDVLHKIISVCEERKIELDYTVLRELDKRWQAWAANHTDPEYVLIEKRDQFPKTKWWWWIDRIAELTEQERISL
ncbi:MAG TPA: hypothetical protein VLF59_01885 [Candidatus Saccharimonadales bacterium]|nr:hypothetical protein [Candidatus Saccharimonadales bacterium]